MTIHDFCTTSGREANHRQQDMVQAERFEQQYTDAVEEGTKDAGALNDMADTGDTHRHVGPEQRDSKADKRQG